MSDPCSGAGKWCILALTFVFVSMLCILTAHINFVLRDDDTSGLPLDSHPLNSVGPFPGASHDNIFWIVQMTDLHISRYRGLPERLSHFRSFLKEEMEILRPEVLILTGDLTDAKDKSRQGSRQYEDEWKMYGDAVKDSKVENKTVFLDIRGNHDAFNVPYLEHQENLFSKYSVQGKKHLRSYMHLHKKSYGQYAFIGVDSCPNPGIKRPFNFFGYLDNAEWNRLDHLKADARSSNATIWFGHYPSSAVLSSNMRQLKSLLADGSVYLCGHLHTLGGLVKQMYAIQKGGNLELELGDWLDNRLYRILAIDHDIISFSDQTYKKWPAVVITNPAHSAYLMPKHEPIGRIKHSTHIRILAFSEHPIMVVKVLIDGIELGEAHDSGNHLYTLPWEPSLFIVGLHYIKVIVIDAKANEKVIEQPFTLDPSSNRISLPDFPRFILMANFSTFLKLLFASVWLFTTVPLISLHIYGRVLRGHFQCGGSIASFIRRWYHNYLVLCRTPSLFYPVILFDLYVVIGPWFVGYVMDDYVGIGFVFGVLVMGQLLPMHTTFAYGIVQLLTFNIPLTACIAATAGSGCDRNLAERPTKLRSILKSAFGVEHTLFYLVIAFQVLKITTHHLSYGTTATILSPMFLWPLVFAFVMRRRARTVRRQICSR